MEGNELINATPRAAVLLCAVGERLVAVSLGHVIETMRPLPITPLPAGAACDDVVVGMAVVRGAPVPVVDASRLLGGPTLVEPGRFVSLRTGERCAALAVAEVVGVRPLDVAELRELPSLVSEDAVSRVGALDAKLLFVLQAARLVPDAVWRSLEAGAAP